MTPIAIKYGGKYYVRNLYASAYAKELYLDTCGGAKSDPTSVYNVTTSSVPDRAGVGTGTWKILSAAIPPVKEGEVVKIGDLVYLANQYGTETYLDTCGGSTCDPTSVYDVSTSSQKDRANQKTATWKVVAAATRNDGDPLRDVDPIHLQIQYGSQAYLDTCGGSTCDPTSITDVSTSSQKDRAGSGTAKWSLRPSVSVDWLVEIDDISFDQGVQTTVLQKASGNPKLLFTQKFANPTGAAVEQTLKRVLTKAASFEFLMTQTLAATAAVKGTAGVPGAGSVEASLSIALTLAFGEKWTDTTTETFEFSSTIKVPANTTVNALGSLDWVEDAVIPVKFYLWVAAQERISHAPLSVDEIKRELNYTGFDGSIVDDKNLEKLLVMLTGEFRGSWGVDTTITLAPA